MKTKAHHRTPRTSANSKFLRAVKSHYNAKIYKRVLKVANEVSIHEAKQYLYLLDSQARPGQ